MTCPHCGLVNLESVRYCARCNLDLTEASRAESPITDPALPGTVFENKYEVEVEIGRGGMGVVYRGLDRTLARPVAIKVLPEQFNISDEVVTRFKREARAMAALDHPNVVPVYAIGRQGKLHYFVMKFLDGQTVAERLHRTERRPFPPDEVQRILIQICAGLHHAHQRGLIHRDIKPGNIMIGPDGHVTIMDFGIVKERTAANLTHTGLVLGTPEYIAPEQAQGKGAGPRTDIYSLGVVAYEMLTGRPPFLAETPFSVVLKHIKEAPESLLGLVPGVTPGLDEVVKRCLAKDPERRYASAAELGRALEAVLEGERRRGARITINREFESIAQFIAEYASDISLTGCFIRSAQPLPVGTEVSLTFTLLDSDLAIIEGQGEVMRISLGEDEPSGMGVRFTDLTPDSRAAIANFLASRGDL